MSILSLVHFEIFLESDFALSEAALLRGLTTPPTPQTSTTPIYHKY